MQSQAGSLDLLQRRLGYKFKDEQLLEKALTHKSFSADHNERLEFLGDSLLNNVITIKVFEHYKNREGDLSKLREKMINNANLHRIAQEKLDLEKFIRVAPNVQYSRPNYLADFFEAIVAAVYLDAGSDKWKMDSLVDKFVWEAEIAEQRVIEQRQNAMKRTAPFSSGPTNSFKHKKVHNDGGLAITCFQQNNHRVFGAPLDPTASTSTTPGPSTSKASSSNFSAVAAHGKFPAPNLRKPNQPPRTIAKQQTTHLAPKTTADTLQQLKSTLQTEALRRNLDINTLKMVHGRHPKRSANNQHAVSTFLEDYKVTGFGATREGAHVNSIKLMISRLQQIPVTFNFELTPQPRRSPRKNSANGSTSTATGDLRLSSMDTNSNPIPPSDAASPPSQSLVPAGTSSNANETVFLDDVLMSSDEDEIAIID